MRTEYTNPKEAIAAGEKRYFGAACSIHPEVNGERNAKSRACIACSREKMRQRRADDPDYYRRVSRVAYDKWYPKNKHKVQAYHRFKKTGIDAETYGRLYALQDGKCAVCSSALQGSRPHADHCHETKKPRGILCSTCNQAEGLIKRSGLSAEEFGKKLSEYLKHPTAAKLED